MKTSLYNNIISTIEHRRNNVLKGELNGIPLPFYRFRREFPVIEKGRYYIVTGATKSSKTQISNYLFIYNTVLMLYKYPQLLDVKIFYFPLEETKEQITMRFMCFLLHKLSKGKINISPLELNSTDERRPLKEDILNVMKTQQFKDYFEIYDNLVTFCEERYPTGINKRLFQFAQENGTIEYKTIKFKEKDELTGEIQEEERQVFDKYIPNNPKQIVISIVDHVGLLGLEKDTPTIKLAIEKLSNYMVNLRNKYNFSYVGVQQQNFETTNLEAYKANKIRPTKDGLKDSKRTGEDCDVLIGMTCPYAFELEDYQKYDLLKLKDNFKLLEVVLNRHGRANIFSPLYHDGAINYYKELPFPNDEIGMQKVYDYIASQKKVKQESAPIEGENKDVKTLFNN